MSDSPDDSEDEFDVFSMLGSKSPVVLQEPTRKRPCLFQDDGDFKKLKPPPKTAPPPRFESSLIETLNKSAQLSVLHREDEKKALKSLSKEDTFREKLQSTLSKEALRNHEFVDYLVVHHKELKLEDFFYLGRPKYVKLTGDEPELELGLVESDYVPLQKGDFFNELDIRKIELMEINDIPLDEFLERIGVSRENAELQKITKEQIKLNTFDKLQSPLIILTKFQKFIDKMTTKPFKLETYTKLIRVFSFIIIDKNVFVKSLTQKINDILTTLIKWQFRHDNNVDMKTILHIWSVTSESPKYTYRIVELLDPTRSNIIKQLKTQLCLNLAADFRDFQYFQDERELRSVINQQLLSKMDSILSLKFNNIAEEEQNRFYYDLRIRFQALLTVVTHQLTYGEEAKDPNLVKLKRKLIELQGKIHISYQNSEQAALRSVLFMINAKLKSGL